MGKPNPGTARTCANTWATAISRNAIAPLVNAFCRDHLNPYVNFHRPCLFAETITDANGRQRKRYPYKLMMTPYKKLKSLQETNQFLKPGITFLQLDAQASAVSDNEAAQRLNDARAILFKTIFNRSKTAARMHSNNLAMHPGYTPRRSPPALEGRAAAPCITLYWESIKN